MTAERINTLERDSALTEENNAPILHKLDVEINETLASFEEERAKQLREIENLKSELNEMKGRHQMQYNVREFEPTSDARISIIDNYISSI